jgi:Zinc-finger of C2H2 type
MLTVHLNLKKHRCPYTASCPKKFFTTKDALNFHLSGQHNLVQLKCTSCSQSFDSEQDLQDHKVSGRCFARIISKRSRAKKVETRKRNQREPAVEEFFCEICDLYFAKKTQYSMHYTQKHKTSLTCKHCNKQISSYANLIRHVQVKI